MLNLQVKAKGLVAHGVSACAGCGLELAARHIIEVMGDRTVIVIPPGCAALFSGFGRDTALRIPGFQGNLENTAAYAAGIKAGLEVQGRGEINVLGLAGDGATIDIGLQALSGALERRDRIIYVCYDNEGYMNTGIQCSSSTTQFAWTNTTPGGKPVTRKDLMGIVLAHGLPYAATASVGFINDLRRKVARAKATGGPAFLYVHAPCPTGWGSESGRTIEVAKLAVETRAWVLYEAADGRTIKINRSVAQPKPMAEYLKLQKRFQGVTAEQTAAIAALANAEYERLTGLERLSGGEETA